MIICVRKTNSTCSPSCVSPRTELTTSPAFRPTGHNWWKTVRVFFTITSRNNVMLCAILLYSQTWNNVMLCAILLYSQTWYNVMLCAILLYSQTWYNVMLCAILLYSQTWYGRLCFYGTAGSVSMVRPALFLWYGWLCFNTMVRPALFLWYGRLCFYGTAGSVSMVRLALFLWCLLFSQLLTCSPCWRALELRFSCSLVDVVTGNCEYMRMDDLLETGVRSFINPILTGYGGWPLCVG